MMKTAFYQGGYMNAPQGRLTRDEFYVSINAHIRKHYYTVGDSHHCRQCGTKVMQATGTASIHEIMFGDECGGPGDIERFSLPYCPKCEGKPTRTDTCIHTGLIPAP